LHMSTREQAAHEATITNHLAFIAKEHVLPTRLMETHAEATSHTAATTVNCVEGNNTSMT